MVQHKGLLDIAFKDGDQGAFRATFCRFNVVDLDGDVTVPGAFTAGQKVRIAQWGHNWSAPAIGMGVIGADPERAWVDGRFFLDTSAGMDTYKAVKNLGELQEWSYGFEVKDRSFGDFGDPPREVQFLRALNVFEVSPVMIGAGIDTGTDAIKGAKGAVPYKKTDTSDAGWDGPAAWKALPSEEAALRAATAWVDPAGNPDAKTSYKFIHHEISSDGSVGAANLTACSLGIGSLNGARGGAKIPDGDRQAVWAHLAHHLRDADKEPPELQKAAPADTHGAKSGLSFADHSEAVLSAAEEWLGRVASRSEAYAKEGRVLSQANRDRLQRHLEMHQQMRSELQDLLDSTAPPPADEGKQAPDVRAQYLAFQRTLARLNGAAV